MVDRLAVDSTSDKVGALPPSASSNTVTRIDAFTYKKGTHLVETHVVEPNNVALKLVTTYTRDASGNPTKTNLQWSFRGTSNSRDIETVSAMDASGRWPLTVQNAKGQATTFAYSDGYGLPTSQSDANNLTTTWQYDGLGRETRVTRPDGTYSTSLYKQCSTGCNGSVMTTITQSFGANAVPMAVAALSYTDVLGRTVSNQTWGFDGTEIRSESQYDSLGRLSSTTRPHFVAESPVATTYDSYDDLGRNTHVTVPGIGGTTTVYSGLSTSTTNPKGQVRTTAINGLGRVKRETDPNNQSIAYWYDPFGNLLQTVDPKGNTSRNSLDVRGDPLPFSGRFLVGDGVAFRLLA